uniref:Tectonic domain-containing protein n=1 Tax=Gasterosteus aculeatus aculeatus TaxID=481459 RepID=G3NWY6_GASAC|nr:tectonic-3-like [Gasterosteus aculeatus aculeatus]
MHFRQWFCSFQICFFSCGRLVHAATGSGVTSTLIPSSVDGEPFSSATPAAGAPAAVDVTSVGPTEASTEHSTLTANLDSTLGSTLTSNLDSTLTSNLDSSLTSNLDSTLTSNLDSSLTSNLDSTLSSIATTPLTASVAASEAPPATPVLPLVTSEGCLCDLTPDFCDIGCCCDTVDCGIANLSAVFTGCPQKVMLGVCIEKWLMFTANVDSSLVTVTDSLFCVRPTDNAARSLRAPPPYLALGDSYHFSPPAPTSSSHSRGFYRVDDVIQTYFSNSTVRGLLRQPSPGAAAAFCTNGNPAKFLRSTSLSCTRVLTPQSCATDPNLNAGSYFSDMSLIKTPIVETEPVSDFLIPVSPLSEWPAPTEQNDLCVNVVKNVEFVIRYTERGDLTSVTVDVVLADVDPTQSLLQTHSVQFQLAAPSSPSGAPIPAVGIQVGSPVIGRFDGAPRPLSTLGVSRSGECSSEPSGRAPVLFAHNALDGCTFSSESRNCSELRSQIYGVLRGLAAPDVIAMNFGSQPDWTRVLTQECPVSLQETCESGCVLPKSLSIRVLWARQGPLDLPQNYILGAKYLFRCQSLKCPLSSPVPLTTEVTFVDITLYPEPPRGSPRPDWRFPFGFFSRGSAELDGHVVVSGSVTQEVTWSFKLLAAMLLTGLEFLIS